MCQCYRDLTVPLRHQKNGGVLSYAEHKVQTVKGCSGSEVHPVQADCCGPDSQDKKDLVEPGSLQTWCLKIRKEVKSWFHPRNSCFWRSERPAGAFRCPRARRHLELSPMCTQEQNQWPLDSWSGLWPRPDGIQTSSLRALLQTFTYFCNLIPSWKKQNLTAFLTHWLHKQILQWPLGKNKMAII